MRWAQHCSSELSPCTFMKPSSWGTVRHQATEEERRQSRKRKEPCDGGQRHNDVVHIASLYQDFNLTLLNILILHSLQWPTISSSNRISSLSEDLSAWLKGTLTWRRTGRTVRIILVLFRAHYEERTFSQRCVCYNHILLFSHFFLFVYET